MKNLWNLVLATFLVAILSLGGINPAIAQPVPSGGLDQGLTSLYNNKTDQSQKVIVLKNLGYDIATPFDAKNPPAGGLGDGTFQQGLFDFQGVTPLVSGTDRIFSITDPLSAPIYSVVAGKPNPGACPIQIEDTQIAFYNDQTKAEQKAGALDTAGYLVYVTSNKNVQEKAIKALIRLNCFLVDGQTKKITVDFTEVFDLLPPALQQPGNNAPFVYFPKGDFIYVVNGRKLFK